MPPVLREVDGPAMEEILSRRRPLLSRFNHSPPVTMPPKDTAAALLEEVTQAVVKAVPEIMQHVYVGVDSEWEERACVRCKVLEDSRNEFRCDGRDITLEDILVALGN